MHALAPIELTRKRVGYDTINPPGNQESSANHVAQILGAARFDVKLQRFGERHHNLVATFAGAGGSAPLGFTGQLDTVPLGTAASTPDLHRDILTDQVER